MTNQRAGVRAVVYISTMSVLPGCVSRYGRAKLAIETEARKLGALIVGPGLVFGRQPTLFLAHEDDLSQLWRFAWAKLRLSERLVRSRRRIPRVHP